MLMSMLHWILALMLINDIKNRKDVFGGWKLPWIVLIAAVAFFGSLLYLIFHPKIFYDSTAKKK